MSKTVPEILAIAHSRRVEKLQDLTCRELEVLLCELNRDKYALRDQEAFDLFYMAVIETIKTCSGR